MRADHSFIRDSFIDWFIHLFNSRKLAIDTPHNWKLRHESCKLKVAYRFRLKAHKIAAKINQKIRVNLPKMTIKDKFIMKEISWNQSTTVSYCDVHLTHGEILLRITSVVGGGGWQKGSLILVGKRWKFCRGDKDRLQSQNCLFFLLKWRLALS